MTPAWASCYDESGKFFQSYRSYRFVNREGFFPAYCLIVVSLYISSSHICTMGGFDHIQDENVLCSFRVAQKSFITPDPHLPPHRGRPPGEEEDYAQHEIAVK